MAVKHTHTPITTTYTGISAITTITAITQKPMAHNAAGDCGNWMLTAAFGPSTDAPLPRPLPLLLPIALTRRSWTFGVKSASPHGTVFSSWPWNIASVFDDTTVTESDGGQWKGVSGQQCARSLNKQVYATVQKMVAVQAKSSARVLQSSDEIAQRKVRSDTFSPNRWGKTQKAHVFGLCACVHALHTRWRALRGAPVRWVVRPGGKTRYA